MDFIKRHPVPTYYALTFALSWGVGVVVIGPGSFFGGMGPSDPRFLLVVLTAPLAAGASGLVLTGLVPGRAGYRELLARLRKWRVGLRWYAVALLTAPLVSAAVGLALSLLSPAFLPGLVTADDRAPLVLLGLVAGLWVGTCEELGWTGFAIPRLRLRYGALDTGLTLGLLWGAWHFPLFNESGSFTGALPLALLLVRLFSWLPAYRLLMVWVYDRTGSLPVAILMHASASASPLIFQPSVLSDAQSLTSGLVSAAVWWAVVAAVALARGGQLPLRALRPRVA